MGKGMNKKSKHGVAMDKPLTGNKINLSPLVFLQSFQYQEGFHLVTENCFFERWEEREMRKEMNKESKHEAAMEQPLIGKKINLSPLFSHLYSRFFYLSCKGEVTGE